MKEPRYMSARELARMIEDTTTDRRVAVHHGAWNTVRECDRILALLREERHRRDPEGLRP